MSNRLLITGDTHGEIDIHKLSTKNFPFQKELDKTDILIVLGDFGVLWDNSSNDKYIQKWWNDKNFTTIAIAGNHENYDLLYKLPVVEKFGGRLYQVADSVFYTVSGDIYNFNGHICQCINGADSYDKEYRTQGISWWAEEAITDEVIYNAFLQLDKNNYKVDYLFTHTGGSKVTQTFGFKPTESDIKLDKIIQAGYNIFNKNYKHYCGHYHEDYIVDERTRIVYNDIIEIY